MQGRIKIFLDISKDIIISFKAKVKLWIHRMENAKIAAFPALNAFLEENEFDLNNICGIFLEHLHFISIRA